MSTLNLALKSEQDILTSTEPQVTSEDPEERKEARRIRIKKRQEAQKKQELPPEELPPEEETLVEITTAECAAEIQRLALEANAKVVNVKVAADEREVVRRQDQDTVRDDFLQKLEEEDIEAHGQYEEIVSNWEPMLRLGDPLEIDEKMKMQKDLCDELLSLKTGLVNRLKKDLGDMDSAYVTDMDKQNFDIKELSDRIEKQLTLIQRTNEKQLLLISQALETERNAAIAYNQKRWEALYKQRDKEELEQMDERFEQVEEFVLEMDEIMWDHIDKYRETKIELEVLIQELQKELEKLKATCIINSEKIGYNYQVLKKREEENIIVRSQQKRALNKFTDVTNALRMKIDKAKALQAVELVKSKKEIQRLRADMEQMQNKAHHFALVNDKKWWHVWLMNRERCDAMYNDVCFAEKMIHELVLVEDPPPPPGKPPRVKLGERPYSCSACDKCFTQKSSLNVHTRTHDEDSAVLALKRSIHKKPENKLLHFKRVLGNKIGLYWVNRILTLIADNTGFLVEERLHALLEKYQKTSQNLCRIDAIFSALGVTRAEDVKALCSVMLRHARCPVCVASPMDSVLKLGSKSPTGITSVASRTEWNIAESTKHVGTSAVLTAEDIALKAEAERIMKKSSDVKQLCEENLGNLKWNSTQQNSVQQLLNFILKINAWEDCEVQELAAKAVEAPKDGGSSESVILESQFQCSAGHPLEIDPTLVLVALSEFVSNFVSQEKEKLNDLMASVQPPDNSTPSRKMAKEEVVKHWNQYAQLYTPSKSKFWDHIIQGLTEYYELLQDRAILYDDVVTLREEYNGLKEIITAQTRGPET